jgi:hypothetical protein
MKNWMPWIAALAYRQTRQIPAIPVQGVGGFGP